MNPNKSVDLERLRLLLESQPRNALLLEFIVMTTATVPAILSLRVSELKGLASGDPLPSSLKSGSNFTPVFTTAMKHSLERLLQENNFQDTDFIFLSHKGSKPLSPTSVSRLVRTWIRESGLESYNGIRGLRQDLAPKKQMADKTSEKEQGVSSAYGLPKIKILTRQETVFRELEKAIISGQIPPGQKLVTETIARQMGVSRIPVREALGRLEARGFITTRPKWGSVVNELSRENLKEILELRLLLECEAVARAARSIHDATLSRLRHANADFARIRAMDDADQLLQANRDFHLLAYKDSNAPILLELINQLWDRVSPYYNIMFRQSLTSHPKAGVDFHEQLIQALSNRDEEEAKYWIKADLIRSAEFVLKLFDLHQRKKVSS